MKNWKTTTRTLMVLGLILGLAGAASGVEVTDGCDPGIPDNIDIEKLSAAFDGQKITILLELCAAPSTEGNSKYRVHLDHTAPFADETPFDCRGNSNPDLCCTTSDDTMIRHGSKRGGRDTGPGMITDSGDTLTFMVTLAELGLDPQQGDTEVLIWADTQFKSLRDRAPNTDSGNGCSKPETLAEVLVLPLTPGPGVKFVFVTSTTHTGDLMTEGGGATGLEGADNICNARAQAAGLPGTYTAWLSDPTANAKDRVTQSAGPYHLPLAGAAIGEKVADDFADILACPGIFPNEDCLDFPIGRDATGTFVGLEEVWTGTRQNGNFFGGATHCANWTDGTSASDGRVGRETRASSQWTSDRFRTCNLTARLYCFQDC